MATRKNGWRFLRVSDRKLRAAIRFATGYKPRVIHVTQPRKED
jgi:hypothetical protein